MTSPESDISAAFPFASRYADVLGSRMHYIEEGEGEPVLFLHGQPTSSYLWRNIVPLVSPHARCIAPDLIGMGRSDKPDIGYQFADHARYLDTFIEGLGLERVTLVIHDWGSGLGFHWAKRHPDRVRGIAFMEAILEPATWAGFRREFRLPFRMMRAPGVGFLMISVANVFVKQILPQSVVRTLTTEEMEVYSAPYPTVASRRPVRQWPTQIPIDGHPAVMHEIVSAYNAWLQQTDVPKLLLHAQPGAIVTPRLVRWCRDSLKSLETANLGEGLHYLQEDHPRAIGERVARWYVDAVQAAG